MSKTDFKLKIKEISNSNNSSFINTSEYTKKALGSDKKKITKMIQTLEEQIENNSSILECKKQQLLDAKEYYNVLLKLEVNI